MSLVLDRLGPPPVLRPLDGAARVILDQQRADGAIPWFDAGPWDPWNHAECLMALGLMGEFAAADRGFDYLSASQETSGAWLAEYGNTLPMADRVHMARGPAAAFRDSNFAAYPAVALWHRYRLDGDMRLVRRHWPMVRAATRFVLSLQHPQGDISWSAEAFGGDDDDATVAGNASIYKSLDCALKLAAIVGDPHPAWAAARTRLRAAIANAPARYDRVRDRADFAMDWYYPILAGVYPRAAGFARLEARASRFIAPGLGCRCVASQPWVTTAESCELAMTLVRLGATTTAKTLLEAQAPRRDADGAYWMGWQFEEKIVWPAEKPTWTQAAAILAFDALYGASSAHDVLVAE